jgi:hypothetical protein
MPPRTLRVDVGCATAGAELDALTADAVRLAREQNLLAGVPA